MAEKIKQALASVKGYMTRKDEQLPTSSKPSQSEEEDLKRQKRIKLFTYIGIFIVFQIIVMTVFGLTVMKVKTPKVRLGGAIDVQELTFNAATPSLNTSFATQIRVKNTNWGPYKFDASVATFMYQGLAIGHVNIPKSKAGMRSTKKVDVTVNLSTDGLATSPTLSNELSSGVVTLTSQAKLTGKVELMLIMKKKKSANMDCTMEFDLSNKTVKSLQCK